MTLTDVRKTIQHSDWLVLITWLQRIRDHVFMWIHTRANSQDFFYNLKSNDFLIKSSTKAFLLHNQSAVFCLETTDVDAIRVLLAQVLINLETEADFEKKLNEILFTDFNSFTTMSLEQNEDFEKNFPDLLVCKLANEEQLLLDKQSHIVKSWMDAVKINCKKIIFIVENPKHLEQSMKHIKWTNIFKIKLNKLWEENEISTNNEAVCEVKNDEANLDEPSGVKNESARALDEDTNVNAVEEENGQTSLHGEATTNDDNAELVKLLQSLGVAELDAVDEDGDTQLHLAARDGRTQIVESLLAHGAKKDIQNRRGETALHLAAEFDHSAIVHMLLEHGFNVNATDNYQYTPLHCACMNHNDADLIEILLKFGAGIERKDINGQTALHLASQMGCDPGAVVNSLLKHGAHINAQDNAGDSPLHEATSCNNQEVVLLLLEHGADLSIKNKRQQNAFDIARSKNYTNLIRIFKNHKKCVTFQHNKINSVRIAENNAE